MLGNFRKTKLISNIFYTITVQKSSRTTKWGWYLPTLQNFSNFQKEHWSITRNIVCFIINIIIARKKFSAHPIYLSFSKFSSRQKIFWSRNLSPNMPKITLFLLKNRKICPVLPPYASSGWGIHPRLPHLPYHNTNFSLHV